MKTKLKKIPLKFKSFFRSGPNIFSIALCVAAAVVIVTSGNDKAVNNLNRFEAGKVADRDVVAGVTASFIDEEATRIRMETAERETPAVFRFSPEAHAQILDSWNSFCDFTDRVANREALAARLAVDAEYPANFTHETIDAYFATSGRAAFRNYGIEILDTILERGIYAFHHEEMKRYNHEIAEVLNSPLAASRVEFIPYTEILTMADVREALGEIIRKMEAPVIFKAIAVDLLRPFIRENVFFSFGESQNRIEDARNRTAPVILTIEKGKKIIRKGFIVTETEMMELRTLHFLSPGRDTRNDIGMTFLILLFYILLLILRDKIILGRVITTNERYLLSALTGFYVIGTVLLKNFFPGFEGFPVSLAVPTALLIMILAVFMGTRTALIMALVLPLGAHLSGAFDFSSYIIALVSGAAASTVLHTTQNRMGLLKAGLIIAAANCFAVIVVLLIQGAVLADYPALLFWAAMNGIISGMLILGFLPPLEQALNAVTPFRLMELSDLNAPVLRKLFTVTPGTYSHSLMVANLAEQACQDIGANALLARVGAYYHDIGKMDNPEYFVENQTDHNRHDEIAPRLSATVIRSHVKLGVEKAHSLGLPKDIIAIIHEHHGNSVISWFYNKAMEQEEDVNAEDFSYPGNPPRSRESAVVMLADVTEAAVRTLSKPTAGKMEKFIQQLFESKVDHGQLAESELSFRDLEKIKKAFVKTLAGYYHSRIEYPKQKEENG